MAGSVEELTVQFTEEDGVITCKEIAKEVLTKGTWATVMYLFADLDRKSGEYKAPKMCIRRYQKRQGDYKVKSKFNFSSAAQARQVADILLKWAEKSQGNEESAEED